MGIIEQISKLSVARANALCGCLLLLLPLPVDFQLFEAETSVSIICVPPATSTVPVSQLNAQPVSTGQINTENLMN